MSSTLNPKLINQIDTSRQLQLITNWIIRGEPFIHTRYNDGEFDCMFSLLPEERVNCDGSHFYRSAGDALRESFLDIWRYLQDKVATFQNVIIGSQVCCDPEHSGPQAFMAWLSTHCLGWESLPWGPSDWWAYPQGVDEDNMIPLLNEVRRLDSPAVFVSCQENAAVADALEADFVSVPRVDAWRSRERILEDCMRFGKRLFIWSAGWTGKPLAWQLFRKNDSSHIDAGSFFDGVFYRPSRDWMNGHQDGDAPGVGERRLKWYTNRLVPYLKGE